jgi:large subunit ribosomal protein L23
MALRDIFKKKPKDYNPPATLPQKRAPKPAEEIKEDAVVVPKRALRKTVVGEAHRVLKTPQVTEKATGLVGQNQYVFKVWPKTNKVETKKAIEDLYGVDVISVKIIKVPRKQRRLGRISGWRKGYKKAIVKIKEGQKIEVLPR